MNRELVLIKAMVDMMDKQVMNPYVQNIFELTAVWDGAECDGACWYDEAMELLEVNDIEA
jgi:hypothetical protein